MSDSAGSRPHVTLTFVLDEEVTPDVFARKVALACASGALRPGEGIRLPSDPSSVIEISDRRLLDDPVFDWLNR